MEGGNLAAADLDEYVAVGSIMFPDEDWVFGRERVNGMLRQWPRGIFAVRDRAGEIVAYRTLWPLNARASVDLMEGVLTDDRIDAKALVGKGESLEGADWLMSSIAVRSRVTGSERACCIGMLLRDIDTTLSHHRGKRLFAHAATESGLKFLIRNGFEVPFKMASDLGFREMTLPLLRNPQTNRKS